jgi:hypothetical protein
VTAEAIAAVVADIRAGRVEYNPSAFDTEGEKISAALLKRAQQAQPVVDCTAIFTMCQQQDEIRLYDDHPSITPPWPDAMLCYTNTFGNVLCLQVHLREWNRSTPSKDYWSTPNPVDWWRVRWVAETTIWVGGSTQGQALRTAGPCHMFRHAIYADGSPADINWVALMARRNQFSARHHVPAANSEETWEAPLITLGAALNFLNASNVDVAEPVRSRPERRRLARTGVEVQTIVVRPPGKRRAAGGASRPIDPSEAVLSPVRGHWARYGPQFNRGLLFGKYSGKFWIPGFARGGGEAQPRDYTLKPTSRAQEA